MVFGWGKKKKEEKKPIEITPLVKEIHLSDIPKVIHQLEELRESQVVSQIKTLRDNTEPLIEDLIKIGNVLEKDNLKVDDIDKHLAIIVVRGKKQVIDVIKKGVSPLPKVSSLDDAIKLNSILNQILKKVGDVLGRQTRVIHIFAKKYASQLKESLEIMNSNHSEIDDLLKNYDSTKSNSIEIMDSLDKIKNFENNRIAENKKLVDLNQNLTKTDENILSLEKSIIEAKSSENYKKYLNLKNELGSFSAQKTKIKNEIDSQFTKISRPLSRYEYGSSLDKDQKNLLSELLKNPFDVILPHNIDSIIIILENVRKGIISGSISVKDTEKSLSQLTETEESLEGFEQKISDYLNKYKEINSELQTLYPKDLTNLENDLVKNNQLKEEYKEKIKTTQKELSDIDSNIPNLVSQIEKKLRQFSNTRYAVIPS